MQISAASPFPNFHFIYATKISVYFLAICANFPCKIGEFELEFEGFGILGTGFCFNISYKKITAKK